MKKLFIIAFLALGFYQAQAQVTFRPGLRGGLNFHILQKEILTIHHIMILIWDIM